MTRRHHVLCHWSYLLLTAVLSAVAGMQATATDTGYPPPPGLYRSESRIPQPATQTAEPAIPHSVDTDARETRRGTGMLPLPADTFSASDTADILFGSVPALPSSTTDSNDPQHSPVKGSVPSSAGQADTGTIDALPEGIVGSPKEFRRDMPPPYPVPGIPDSRHYPPRAPAYPTYQQPAPAYYPGYQAYPGRPENQYSGFPPTGGYEASYPMSDSYLTPSTADPVPGNALEQYPPPIEMADPAGPAEAAAPDIFRPAE